MDIPFLKNPSLTKAVHQVLVDLINRSNGTLFKYEELELVSITNEAHVVPYSSIPSDLRFKTTARMKLVATNEEVDLNYLRLSLATYLYRGLVDPVTGEMPVAVWYDTFNSDGPVTVEADALAYLSAEYGVPLTDGDVTAVLALTVNGPDSTRALTLTMRNDHPLWVGAIVLDAVFPPG